MRRRTSIIIWALGLLWAASPLPAASQDVLIDRPREPADVMSWRGADWLERPQRVAEERPDEVLAVMALEDGDVVADLGAGSGFFTRRIARLVAPTGTVYAVDIQPEMLDLLMESVEEEGLTGVVPVLGEAADPRLPQGEVDWVLLVDVYHELADPVAMLAQIRRALAPGGRVALVEYRDEDGTGDHIRSEHRMSVRQVLSEWTPAGFELLELHESLPSQHLFVFGAADAPDAPGDAIEHLDLLEAMARGAVEANAFGQSGEQVQLTIRRTAPGPLVVTLPIGTYFAASGGAGDMIARRDGMVLLAGDAPRGWRVAVRRAHQSRPVPAAADHLEIRSASGYPELADLLWVFQSQTIHPTIAPTIEQLAVWIISEDPGWEDLSRFARESRIHAANAVALAMANVNAAGVDVRNTRIWAERAEFVEQVSDEGLQRILEQLERG